MIPVGSALRLASLILVILTFVSFHRAIIGPSPADRLVAINVIGTKTVVLVALSSFTNESHLFLDVGIVYALLSFIATCGVALYLEKGRLLWRKDHSK